MSNVQRCHRRAANVCVVLESSPEVAVGRVAQQVGDARGVDVCILLDLALHLALVIDACTKDQRQMPPVLTIPSLALVRSKAGL
jgi:hypothetical protein